MRDIPFFTTPNGVASLTLQEIPNNGKAYIHICDSFEPEALLRECCDFCRAVGAESVYADGISMPSRYPHYTDIFEMHRPSYGIPETTAKLIPVTGETLERWRQLYNENMCNIPASFFMSIGRAQEILQKGTGYFVCSQDELMGIGVAHDNRIEAIVSLIPGAGRDVLCALCKILTGDEILLEVSSSNERAINFYKKMGFVITCVKYKWYKVYPMK